MKNKELLRMLENDGWYLHSQGKHLHYKHQIKEGTLIVPNHGSKEIPTGTLESILKAAGLKKNRR